ncbi:MAG TPA: NAD(P)H-dependent oxidoreductase subunit E [Chloroflexota bacterium]|nr:NAD(P)H-dependent oxidoreductase subunit E [Chloroflexota bacterium]
MTLPSQSHQYHYSYERPDWEARVREICRALEPIDGASVIVLHKLMADFGYISEEATKVVAEELHLTASQMFAVATFYHEFRLEKPAENVLMLCRGPACRVGGMVELRKLMEQQLGIDVGERTEDDKFAIESSGCLGVCPHAPAMLINHHLAGRVTREALEQWIAERLGTPV